MKAVENIQFVIYTDKWPNTYLYPPVYVTYIKPEFHVQHLSKKKRFSMRCRRSRMLETGVAAIGCFHWCQSIPVWPSFHEEIHFCGLV